MIYIMLNSYKTKVKKGSVNDLKTFSFCQE